MSIPSINKFGHLLENHEHSICKNDTTLPHLHNTQVKCFICYFQLSSFTFSINSFPELSIFEDNFRYINNYSFSEKNTFIFASLSRGPPTLL